MHDKDPEVRKKSYSWNRTARKNPSEDILPLLEEVQYEDNKNARKMIIHVLGQISCKKGCLEKVVAALKTWQNKELIKILCLIS